MAWCWCKEQFGETSGIALSVLVPEGPDESDSASEEPTTPLFDAVKRKDWLGVLLFLQTGRWIANFFDYTLADPRPTEQCRMWVVDSDGERRLPLHKAIIAEAPAAVLERLLEYYGEAVEHADSSGRLPLQIALSVNTSDAVLLALLERFPEAIQKVENNLLRSVDEEGAHTSPRNQFVAIILQQMKLITKKREEEVWKRMLADAGIVVKKSDNLHSVLSLLLDYRRCFLRYQSSVDAMEVNEAFTTNKPSRKLRKPRRGKRSKRPASNKEAPVVPIEILVPLKY